MTQLPSYLGWIDFSDDDQKRAQDYLRSLSEGTLDELGFGIIRDAFGDLFFPATSTIMTRARYFILVPSIYLATLQHGDHGAGGAIRGQVSLREKRPDPLPAFPDPLPVPAVHRREVSGAGSPLTLRQWEQD